MKKSSETAIFLTDRLADEKVYHPKACLRDYYKLAFQAVYGPGHLIESKDSADKYLKAELQAIEINEDLTVQDISFNKCRLYGEITGNYCRLSLKAISDGIITYNDYLSAFLRSAKNSSEANSCRTSFSDYNTEKWLNLWKDTESYLRESKIVKDFSESETLINGILRNSPVSRHSDIYRENYHPHYRLMKKSILREYMEI